MKSPDLSQFKATVAIIAAAGYGSRMQSDTPKQYLKINRQTILDITLSQFLSFEPVELIILVISPQDIYFKHLEHADNEKVIIIEGGDERADSVYNALNFLYDCGLPDEAAIMVHDAVRPCITHDDLDKLSEFHAQSSSPCLLVSPIDDSLQKIHNGLIEESVDRSGLVRALTPQMASFIDLKSSLKNAIQNKINVTDEASALVASGYKVSTVVGRSDNIKITHAEDIALAEFYLKRQNS